MCRHQRQSRRQPRSLTRRYDRGRGIPKPQNQRQLILELLYLAVRAANLTNLRGAGGADQAHHFRGGDEEPSDDPAQAHDCRRSQDVSCPGVDGGAVDRDRSRHGSVLEHRRRARPPCRGQARPAAFSASRRRRPASHGPAAEMTVPIDRNVRPNLGRHFERGPTSGPATTGFWNGARAGCWKSRQ